LLYFHSRALTHGAASFVKWSWRHLLPALLQGLGYLFLQSRDYSFRRNYWFEFHQPLIYDLELALSFVSLFFYLLASQRHLRNYKAFIANHYSDLQRITLRWLGRLQAAMMILSAIWLVEIVLRLSVGLYLPIPLSAISIGATLLLIAGGGLLQPDLSSMRKYHRGQSSPAGKGQSSSPYDPDLLAQVKESMERNKAFLQGDLTLNEFAAQLEASPREVSRAINQGLGLSFVDFVNQARIAEFKRLLQADKPGKYSLVGLAFEAGFNSKSTFQRVFRQQEGMSPSHYRNQVRNRN